MIGALPKDLTVAGKRYPIRSDFRIALRILQAWNDPELKEQEKAAVMLRCLYEIMPPWEQQEEACRQAAWFLDGGPMEVEQKPSRYGKVMDWEQDETMIFSAVNKVAGYEMRAQDYVHWWTFLGFYTEIGESLFASVLSIRLKKRKGKQLERYEQEFYRDNKGLIDLKKKKTQTEREALDAVNRLLRPR